MKWEYLTTWLGFEEDKDLNELGKLGWELVSVVLCDGESPKAYFKRPLRSKSEAEILKHFDEPTVSWPPERQSLV